MREFTITGNPAIRDRHGGFTLVELLTVIVVLSVLASIALPRYGASRDKARLAAVRHDVRNAELSEEAYFADYGQYGELAALEAEGLIKHTSGVSLTVTASSGGFSVSASDPAISVGPKTCVVQVGAGTTSATDGVITCS